MKIYLLFNSIKKDRKTFFIFIFLRRRAKRRSKFNFCKKFNDDKNDKKIFAQFSEFKKKIRRIFEVFNEKQIAK